MFILNPQDFANANPQNLRGFVDYWSQFIDPAPKIHGLEQRINYLAEMNIGHDLTEENIQRLLRWKSPQYLTHVNRQGAFVIRVHRVLDLIGDINAFRNEQIGQDQFLRIITRIFRDGVVYRAFLFHVARPMQFPICDQHVFRAHSLLTQVPAADTWEHYLIYRDWFHGLRGALGITQLVNEGNVRAAKELDSALMVYGQFLAKYNQPAVGPVLVDA